MHSRALNREERNLTINLIEGGVYMSSAAFVSIQTVLPALVARLGGSNVEVGAVGVLAYAGAFVPQLFAARYVETLAWKKPWAVRFGTSQRLMVLFMGLVVLLFGGGGSSAALWLFFAFFLANQVIAGICTPGWFDLFAKLTSAKKRGRLVGFRNALGGAGAFLGSFVLTWLLATFAFPVSYALALFIAFVLQMSSMGLQRRLDEHEPSPTLIRRPIFSFLRGLPHVLRTNREFSRFLFASAFLVVATVPQGFIVVYALKHFAADESIIGAYTLAMVAMQVVSALAAGFFSDRYGNKIALVIASIAMLCASAWAAVAPSAALLTPAFMFMGVNLGIEMMVRFNMAIEYCPPEQRSRYVGLTSTVLAPFYLAGLAGGLLIDGYGFSAVFIAGIIFSLIGSALLVWRVRDPRALGPVA